MFSYREEPGTCLSSSSVKLFIDNGNRIEIISQYNPESKNEKKIASAVLKPSSTMDRLFPDQQLTQLFYLCTLALKLYHSSFK